MKLKYVFALVKSYKFMLFIPFLNNYYSLQRCAFEILMKFEWAGD